MAKASKASLPDGTRYHARVWRMVEGQHKVSTARLTDDLAEQALLESLIEEAKPDIPARCRDLHYLLATPFRYRPYPNGSRFRRAQQRDGVFYASEFVETAVGEIAAYRIRFFRAAPTAELPSLPLPLTAFAVRCATDHALDLTAPPLDARQAEWTDPHDYASCQALADAARGAGIDILRYRSVRDPEHRANIALLSPAAFAATGPETGTVQSWHLLLQKTCVRAWREFPADLSLEFAVASLMAGVTLG